MTELLTFTIYFVFLCKRIWGTLVYHGITVPFVLTTFGERRPHKIFRGTAFPRLPRYPSATPFCDGCCFQIHELQYLCNSHATFFKIFSTDIWSYISVIKQQI